MFCFKCGAELPDGSMFCDKCGTKVGNEQEKPAAEKPNINNQAVVNQIPVNNSNTVKKEKRIPIWPIIVGIFLVICIFVAVFTSGSSGDKNNDKSKESTTSSYTWTEATTKATTEATTEAPTTEAPNPFEKNDFSSIFGYYFSNTKEDFQNTVIQNGYTELPTISHDYAFSTGPEGLLGQAVSVAFDSGRKSYYLDFSVLGSLETVVIRYNTEEDLSKEIERLYGPAQNGEYLGHIGEQALTLIVYQETLMLNEEWEISLSINHQN